MFYWSAVSIANTTGEWYWQEEILCIVTQACYEAIFYTTNPIWPDLGDLTWASTVSSRWQTSVPWRGPWFCQSRPRNTYEGKNIAKQPKWILGYINKGRALYVFVCCELSEHASSYKARISGKVTPDCLLPQYVQSHLPNCTRTLQMTNCRL